MPDARTEFAFLLELARPYRVAWLAGLVLLLVESALTLAQPWFAANVTAQLLAGRVPGDWLLAWFAALAALAVLSFTGTVLAGSTTSRVVADLGLRVFDHLQSLPVRWHQERRRGEVLSLLNLDVWRLGGFLTDTLAPMLPLALTFAGALVLLLRVEPRVGLVVAAGVVALVFVLKVLARRLRPLAEAGLQEDAIKQGLAEQALATLPLIKAFTQEARESTRYAAQSGTVRDLETRQLRQAAALAPLARLAGAAAVLGLLWFGARHVAAGTLTPPQLVALLLYGLLLVQPLAQLAAVYGRVQGARGSTRRLLALFAEAPEPDTGRIEPDDVRGNIAFEQVAFAYPGRPAVFTALDLRIGAGETLAVTGENGAGKSTLAHLLLRFADPQGGRITLDGVDLREISLRRLREAIGLVSQHVLLLNDTVARNIGYGRHGATREDIERAARAAHAHAFIAHLPQGYDTVIGDDGVRLSGGQKQRLALARALLKDPAILILDEATAMFDPDGERDFLAECHVLLRNRTVLLITHRPASLALADRTVRIEGGQAVAVPGAKLPAQALRTRDDATG